MTVEPEEDEASATQPLPPKYAAASGLPASNTKRAASPRGPAKPRRKRSAVGTKTATTLERQCALGHAISAKAKFCSECGQPVAVEPPKEWVCGLGHVNEPQAKFCPECGSARDSVAATPVGADPRPVPWELLTPEQQAERQRAHADAIRMGREDPAPQWEAPPKDGDVVWIHFVEDGFSFAGQIWYRGQDLALAVGSPRWWEAARWIQMDEFQQLDRYGKVMFRPGKWRGKKYSDASPQADWPKMRALGASGDSEQVLAPTEEQLRQADEAEARRRGAVPAPTMR